jgi:hypothetical protein
MAQDFILNGSGYGPVAEALVSDGLDVGLRRPFKVTNPRSPNYGKTCVTVNTGRRREVTDNQGQLVYNELGLPTTQAVMETVRVSDLIANGDGLPVPVTNATTLRKEEWIELDQVILREARYRLRAWADLANANSFGGFNGMSKLILEHETMSDPGAAVQDMDGISPAFADSPLFQLQGLPLPITHADFWFPSRRLSISRNTGTPLDTVMGEAAGRRVAELIEQTLIGTISGITLGSPSGWTPAYGRANSVYGYTNFPPALTYTGSVPTAGGYTASKTLADVLSMIDVLTANKFYGPFMLYHTGNWDHVLDNDYILTGGNVATQTLRNRLRSIEIIQDVRRLDFFLDNTYNTGPFKMLLVQMTPDVARAVNGMDITTVQWEAMGGMKLNFKVMAIQVPQLRATFAGNCGILYAQFA